MIAARITLATPGGFGPSEVVGIIERTVHAFRNRAADAIESYAKRNGLAPIAVDYTINPGGTYEPEV